MNGWKVIYYISARGKNPVKEFLDLHPKAKLKALRILSHIEEFGLSVAIPHIKKLSGTPLWEIRILGEVSVRILYAVLTDKQIVLLHAFIKKTNKTPRREIELSLSRLKEYE